MLRAATAVAAGLIAWFAVATIANLLVRFAWPSYAQVELAMTFTLPMLFLRLFIGALSSVCSGLVAALIARSGRRSVSVLAGILLILFVPVHYSLWARFPIWYHVVFLSSLVFLPFLGGRVSRLGAARMKAGLAP
jgi:hypothetical protein